jgi:hypothetical protein
LGKHASRGAAERAGAAALLADSSEPPAPFAIVGLGAEGGNGLVAHAPPMLENKKIQAKLLRILTPRAARF